MGNNNYERKIAPFEGIVTSDVILSKLDNYSIKIISIEKWYKRIWNYISNPFTYIFCGKIRY